MVAVWCTACTQFQAGATPTSGLGDVVDEEGDHEERDGVQRDDSPLDSLLATECDMFGLDGDDTEDCRRQDERPPTPLEHAVGLLTPDGV